MTTLIEQIQREALNNNASVTSLLRKVKLAASKLDLDDVAAWVKPELAGYEGSVPDYRIISGTPKAFNPMRGWIPLLGSITSQLSKRGINQSMSALEDLVRRVDDDGGHLEMPFSPQVCAAIDKNSNYAFHRYSLFIDRAAIVHVIDHVRNLVLDWTLELERSGVKGTEFDFTDQDRERAQMGNVFNIGTIGSMIGNLGSGNRAGAITVNDIDVETAKDISKQIERYLPHLKQDGIEVSAIQKQIELIKREIAKPKPSQSLLREAFSDIRNALSGAGGNLIAGGILDAIKGLLG